MNIIKKPFGKLSDGRDVTQFCLSNNCGMTLEIIDYRGIITTMIVPDRSGNPVDVTLGYDKLEDYVADQATYFGAIVGAYANRIANAEFNLDGKTYALEKNYLGRHCLHSGAGGINDAVWRTRTQETDDALQLILNYVAVDGEQGFPGNREIELVYSLKKQSNEFSMDYCVKTDAPTCLNLTNHAYYNLSGAGDILDHTMRLNADFYTPTDAEQLTTGEILSVSGTPFDFRQDKKIAQDIHADHQQLRFGKGYDHNFLLNKQDQQACELAAYAYSESTGIGMAVYTDKPAIQFYSGNHLTDIHCGKNNSQYHFRSGFCLETQYSPDALHYPHFSDSRLNPGDVYRYQTIHRFTA
ncbi:MAG: aldose epimerase family protein [Pseudomonadota bacterium]